MEHTAGGEAADEASGRFMPHKAWGGWTWLRMRRRMLWVEYGVLALVVMGPLLKPGYVFALDMVFTPRMPWPTGVDNAYLYNVFLHYLSLALPSQIIQKLLLFGILLLAGVGMHLLAMRGMETLPAQPNKHKDRRLSDMALWGGYFAGILYMVNPFTYERLVAGQYLLVFGYALTPFFILALWRFLQRPGWRAACSLAAWALLISIISIHSIFFMFILAVVLGLAEGAKRWQNKRDWWQMARYDFVAVVLFLTASSYWIVPLVQGNGPAARAMQVFDERQIIAFRTATDNTFGVLIHVAALYGFWGERDARYTLPMTVVNAWLQIFLLMFGLVAWGVVASWRRDRAITLAMGAVGIVGWVLAIGVAYGPFAGIYHFMVDHVPLFRGYREPQKFVGLLVLVYAYFGAFGVREFLVWIQRSITGRAAMVAKVAPVMVLLLPIFYTPTMLWGFAGQLPPADYPKDWYALNQELNADRSTFKVLFLPWHEYMSFSFSQAIVANPADNFFDRPVIQGDNFELADIQTQVNNPVSNYVVDKVLNPRDNISDTGARLAPLNVKYIVLAKEVDWKKYDFLNKQKDLKLIKDTANLRVYINMDLKR